MSGEHFTVDGTLIQAWASQESFQAKDGLDKDGDGTSFHGAKRSNETHASISDPDARLYKKSHGRESTLAYLGHALVRNRNGLIAQAMATQADGFAEREAALLLLTEQQQGSCRRITVRDRQGLRQRGVCACPRALNVINACDQTRQRQTLRRSNMDGRTTRHPGYAISLSRRWLVQKTFGWRKQTAPIGRIKVRGQPRVDAAYVVGCAALNLLRLRRLIAQERRHDLGQQRA